MRTPAEIDDEIAALVAERARVQREHDARVAELSARIDRLEAERRSTRRDQSGTTEPMVSAARAHISAGRSRQLHGGKTHPLIEAASKKGHTYRSLAAEIEKATGRPTPHTIISRALGGGKSTRPIRRSAARVIEAITGYKATPGNWPGGWASEDEPEAE